MFSRNSDRSANDERRGISAPPGVRDVPTSATLPSTMPMDVTLIARADHVEGVLRVADTLRVLGTLEGSVEATSVQVEEGATVHADVTADEVVIGGEYSGKLQVRQRLEIRASGRVSGQIETFRLMLHEGASIDGELHMLKQAGVQDPASGRGATIRGGLAEVGIRAATPPGAPVLSAPLPPGAEPIG